jgi:hypothetical protein
MDLMEAEAKKGEREADAIAGGDELLGEEDCAERAEQIQRPRDRPCDEQGCEAALRYPFQIPASLKYWMAPG